MKSEENVTFKDISKKYEREDSHVTIKSRYGNKPVIRALKSENLGCACMEFCNFDLICQNDGCGKKWHSSCLNNDYPPHEILIPNSCPVCKFGLYI